MKKLSLGIQDFKEIRENAYIYIDKSELFFNLITNLKYCFLSRPRRFGKSLLISTLGELFLGNKELFKGLWIYDKIEWQKNPVIRIDFSQIPYKQIPLADGINLELKKIAQAYDITLDSIDNKYNFRILIEEISKKSNSQVVILIDEYDKPIIDYLGKDLELAEENRDTLKNFYSIIKPMDSYLKFVLLTGVSKFSKVSIFSDLNNLKDITSDSAYSEILGYTEAEILDNYPEYLQQVCEYANISLDDLILKMRVMYNGYSFDGKKQVYNPFSVLNFLSEKEFKNYWFDSGTPTFLVDFIKDKKILPETISQIKVTDNFFSKFDLRNLDIFSLMFQTGYLTIKRKTDFNRYDLDFPNKEVRNAFYQHLLASYNYSQFGTNDNTLFNIVDDLQTKNIDSVIQHFKSLFASIPYEIFLKDYEAYYHSILYIALNLIGVYLKAEVQTNKGRIDAVMETDKYVYILEFKIGTAETALQQIKDMKYYEKFQSSGKEIILLGIGFNKEDRNICEYLFLPL